MFWCKGGFGQVDYPFAGAVAGFKCISGVGSWEPGCPAGCHCCVYADRRCGGYGCGRNCWIAGGLGGSTGKMGWHILVSAQSAFSIDVAKILCLPVGIMMVSISFVKQAIELIDLSFLCFVMSVFFYFVYK